jgi:hypothetical protein
MKGPLLDEKAKRGVVISADQPLYLPFDGDLPYFVSKLDWKNKKNSKSRGQSRPKPAPKVEKKKPQPKPKKTECPVTLSLLSAFCDDIVPPIPILLLTEKECQERIRRETQRARGKTGEVPRR